MIIPASDNRRPHFKIIHRHWRGEMECGVGEEILAVLFLDADRELQVPLSVAGRMVFDFLARHQRVYQTATQIASGMGENPFYARHAANGHPAVRQTRRFNRPAVKVYLLRLQQALNVIFAGVEADWDAAAVLSRMPIGNEVAWRLEAVVQWEHLA